MARTRQTTRMGPAGVEITELFKRANRDISQTLDNMKEENSPQHPPSKKQRIDKASEETNSPSSSAISMLSDDIWIQILTFAIADRITGYHLERTCKKFAEFLSNNNEGCWSTLVREWKLVVPTGDTEMQTVLDSTYHFMFRDALHTSIQSSLNNGLQILRSRGDWLWDRYGKSVTELPQDEQTCWKEFFHLAYHNQRVLTNEDIERCPLVYQRMKNDDAAADMFSSTVGQATSPATNIQFHEDSERSFKWQDPIFKEFDPTTDKEGILHGSSVEVNEQPVELTEFQFSRMYTVYRMVKKIDLDSIDTVYAYRKCIDSKDQCSTQFGGMIGKLKDGRFFRFVSNVFSKYFDYNCGAIWLANKFSHLMYIDEIDAFVR